MFDDKEIKILSNSDNITVIKTEYADIQPFSKTYTFENGFSISTTMRAFCDANSIINEMGYVLINNEKYKVIDIKTWDTYKEAFLYKCKK
jgi:nitrous oxidase accessory protein NosD